MYGEHPIELGLGRGDGWVQAIAREPVYERLFASAFRDQPDPVTRPNVVNPNKAPAIRRFTLTTEQRSDLIAFLQSLTDDALLRDPRFANPWAVAHAER